MATNYPGSLDSLSNPAAGNPQNSVSVPHAQQHANINDAMEAVQAELGTNPSGSSSTVKARLEAIESSITSLGDTAFGAIPTGGITTAKIADSAVTTQKLNNSSVTAAKLASNAVTESKIADASVSQDKIKSKAINYSKVDTANYVHVRRTSAQSITASTGAYITWTTETADLGGYITVSSDTISIPSNRAGLYSITFNAEGIADSTTQLGSYIRIEAGGFTATAPFWAGVASCSLIVPIAAAGTIKGYVNNARTSGQSVTAQLVAVRLFANYT